MEKNKKIRNRILAEKIIKGLESRNMEGFFAESKEEAFETAMKLIPEGSSIGWGGSMSVDAVGIKEALNAGNYQIYDRDACKTEEEKRQTELAVLGSDIMLCSSNAVTEDGILVNIDGRGNRAAGIIYGPRTVIMVVGMNKVVKTPADAMNRARNEAAPINAQRFGIATPCVSNGMCADCKSPDCICCQILITRYSKSPRRIKVILVDENLGF